MNNSRGASASASSAALLRDNTLGAWVHSFKGFFPSDDGKSREWHDHLPGHERAPKRTLATAAGRRREVEALIVAAVSVRDARPADRAHQLVYAAWCWPDWQQSQFGVFLDAAYGRGFEDRHGSEQRWTLLDPVCRSLSRELGFRVPNGFIERGFHQRIEEEDREAPNGISVFEGEVWFIREPFDT